MLEINTLLSYMYLKTMMPTWSDVPYTVCSHVGTSQ